jgi:type II secretory pathway pseudopilin PulG
MKWSLLRFLVRYSGKPDSPSSEGLTLIECLVAIVVISLTIVAITPPIFLATATRVQSRKAERAMQVAQAEIDRVRVLVERGNYTMNTLPAPAGENLKTVGVANAPGGQSPLSSPASCNTYPGAAPVSIDTMIRVDVDGDCVPEYAMQVFRTNGTIPTGGTSGTTPPFNFEMGVRVYSYSGTTFTAVPLAQEGGQAASQIMGTGPRENAGGDNRRPMAIAYSAMARNDDSRSLGRLCRSVDVDAGRCNF